MYFHKFLFWECPNDLIQKNGEARIVDIANKLEIAQSTANKTITRLLPQATAEDLQYMVITYSICSDLIKLLFLYVHKFI